MKRLVPFEQAVAMVADGAEVIVVAFTGVGVSMRLMGEPVRQRRMSLNARRMLRRWGEPELARIGGVGTAIELGTMAGAPSGYFVPPAFFLAVFGLYALHNTSQANATQMASWGRGTAVSLFACSLFLGRLLGVLGAAWLVYYYTASAAFSVLAMGLLVLGIAHAVSVNQRGRL